MKIASSIGAIPRGEGGIFPSEVLVRAVFRGVSRSNDRVFISPAGL